MYSVPTQEPTQIVAGDSAIWTKSLAQFPATEGWTLSYNLLRPDGKNFYTFAATTATNGIDYSINVLPAVTQPWVPGLYNIQGKVSKAGPPIESHTVWTGQITIAPGLSAAAGDTRSHAKKVLDNLKAVMESRATDDILDSVVEGTVIRRLPIEQLMLLRDRYEKIYKGELAAARIANGQGSGRNIFVRLGLVGGSPIAGFNPYGRSGNGR